MSVFNEVEKGHTHKVPQCALLVAAILALLLCCAGFIAVLDSWNTKLSYDAQTDSTIPTQQSEESEQYWGQIAERFKKERRQH